VGRAVRAANARSWRREAPLRTKSESSPAALAPAMSVSSRSPHTSVSARSVPSRPRARSKRAAPGLPTTCGHGGRRLHGRDQRAVARCRPARRRQHEVEVGGHPGCPAVHQVADLGQLTPGDVDPQALDYRRDRCAGQLRDADRGQPDFGERLRAPWPPHRAHRGPLGQPLREVRRGGLRAGHHQRPDAELAEVLGHGVRRARCVVGREDDGNVVRC
jgi:hypothetical protein